MTVAQAIDRALRLLGVVDPDETTAASDRATGLIALNAMLQTWATTMQGVNRVVRESFDLVSGTATYTIGSGATFDTTRPNQILSAFIRSSDIDYGVEIISAKDYDEIYDKSLTAIPYSLYFDPNYANGSITLYPVPNDSDLDLHITSVKPYTAYSLTTEDVGLPPEFEAAIPHNLAVELAPEYGVQNIGTVAALAGQKLKAAKRLHAVPVSEMVTDITNTRSIFDYRVGY